MCSPLVTYNFTDGDIIFGSLMFSVTDGVCLGWLSIYVDEIKLRSVERWGVITVPCDGYLCNVYCCTELLGIMILQCYGRLLMIFLQTSCA